MRANFSIFRIDAVAAVNWFVLTSGITGLVLKEGKDLLLYLTTNFQLFYLRPGRRASGVAIRS
jgi:hypothetical protein